MSDHVTYYTTQIQHIANYGVSKRKKFNDDICKTCKFWNKYFWAEGYEVSTVGLNTVTIQKYIRKPEKED